MTQALDRLRKSRELGYSDDQIMHFLAETRGYSRSESEERIRKSLSGGYSTEDIVTLLYDLPKATSPIGPRESQTAPTIPTAPSPYRSPFEGSGSIPPAGDGFRDWVLSSKRKKLSGIVGGVPSLSHEPLIPIGSWTRHILEEGLGDAESDVSKLLYGTAIGATEAIGGLTSPQNVALLAGIAAVPLVLPATAATFVATMVGLYFGAEMARAAIDSIPEVAEKLRNDDLQGAVESAVHGLFSLGFAAVAGRHSVKGAKKLSDKARDSFRYRKGAEDGLKGSEIQENVDRLKKIDRVDKAQVEGRLSEREARSKKEGIEREYPNIRGRSPSEVSESIKDASIKEATVMLHENSPSKGKPSDWMQWKRDTKALSEEIRNIKFDKNSPGDLKRRELVAELTGETPIQEFVRGLDMDLLIPEGTFSQQRAKKSAIPPGPVTSEAQRSILRDLRLEEVKEGLAAKGVDWTKIEIPRIGREGGSPNVDPLLFPETSKGRVTSQSNLVNEVKGAVKSRDSNKLERARDEVNKELESENINAEAAVELLEAIDNSKRSPVPPELLGKRGEINLKNITDNKQWQSIIGLWNRRNPEAKKVTQAEAQAIGREMVEKGFLTEEGAKKMLSNVKEGRALDGPETAAAKDILTYQLNRINEAALEFSRNPSDANFMHLAIENSTYGAIQQGYSKSLSKASASLNVSKKMSSLLETEGPAKALAHMGAQGRLTKEVVEGYLRIPEYDTAGRARYLRDMFEYTTSDKITAYWFANVLSAPATQSRNILGNALQGLLQFPVRLAAGVIDYPLSKIQRRPREHYVSEAFVATYGWFAGIPIGLQRALYVIKNGFDVRDVTKLEMPRIYEFKGALKPLNLGSRSLVAVDTMFKNMAYEAELRALSMRAAIRESKGKPGSNITERAAEIRNNPTAKMIDKAHKFSEFSTFTDNPDAMVRRFSKLRDIGIPEGVVGIGGMKPLRFIVPFINVPWSIAKQGVQLTPAGLFKLTNKTVLKSPEASLVIGKALIGSAVMQYVSTLAATDRLTGAAPKSKSERDNFYRSGRQPFSIKIGDNWYSYKEWGPIAMPLGIAAALYDSFNETNEAPTVKKAQEAATAVAEMVYRGTFMGGIKSIMDAVANPFSVSAERMVRNVASGFVPFSSLLRNVTHTLDPEIKDVESLFDHVKAGLPLISKGVPVRRDVFGDPLVRQGSTAEILTGISRREAKPTAEWDSELRRLKIFPSLTGPSLTIRGEKIDLTSEEKRIYTQIRGDRLKKSLEGIVDRRRYKMGGDDFKRAALKRAIKKAQTRSTNAMKRILRDSRP